MIFILKRTKMLDYSWMFTNSVTDISDIDCNRYLIDPRRPSLGFNHPTYGSMSGFRYVLNIESISRKISLRYHAGTSYRTS